MSSENFFFTLHCFPKWQELAWWWSLHEIPFPCYISQTNSVHMKPNALLWVQCVLPSKLFNNYLYKIPSVRSEYFLKVTLMLLELIGSTWSGCPQDENKYACWHLGRHLSNGYILQADQVSIESICGTLY